MELIKAILSVFYNIGISVRNWLFDAGLRHSARADIPVVCVGNITVGGTGKTPTVALLVDRLSQQHTVAVLSRGYKRRTKGYLEVTSRTSFLDSGDEPKLLKRRYPDTVVVVCEDRTAGVDRIRTEHPEVTMIIMDDGFQHRSFTPKVNIIISDYNRPCDRDHYLPWGTLRDNPRQLLRANLFLITKTPDSMSPIERNIALKSLNMRPYQSAFFTRMTYQPLQPLFGSAAGLVDAAKSKRAIALSGIGNPKPFVAQVASRYELMDTITFPDHHIYRMRDIRKIENELKILGNDVIVVTTEKDGVKLTNSRRIPKLIQQRLFVLPVAIDFRDGDEDKFIQTLLKDVRED